MNKRILALDYGDKTIGVAVSDPLGILAVGVETIRRAEPINLKQSMARLRELISQYMISEIVLGYPKNMNNSEGPRCKQTQVFKQKLENSFRIPITLWDERLSTVAASRSADALPYGKRRNVKKNYLDEMAAVYILQGYLDWKKAEEKKMNLYDDDFEDGNEDSEDDLDIVTMQDEDGNDVDFVVLDAQEYKGVKYLLVVEEADLDDDDSDACIMKVVASDGDMEVYEFVDDDSEFDEVAALFEDDESED